MKALFRTLLILALFSLPSIASAQKEDNKDKNSPMENRIKRKKAKQKWKEGRIRERDNKKAVKKYHKNLQSKQTLKNMKKEKRKSKKYQANKKENFFMRLFRK